MSSGTDMFQVARFRLVRNRPYLATAVMAVRPVVCPGLGTMATDDRWRVYYDPDALARWGVDMAEGVLYHEVLHLLRDHAGRARALNAEQIRWNVAADLEINAYVAGDGYKLPDGALLPTAFGFPGGRLVEEYYTMLSGGPKKGSGGSADDKTPAPTKGNCGSCADSRPRPWEHRDGEDGVSPTDGELIRRRVAEDIRNAAQKSRGSVPAHLERWAEVYLTPKVDWRRVLAAAVRAAVNYVVGAVDYTYSRPSRRQAVAGDVVLPALRRPTPEVAVVVDTSGSISADELAQALAEVRGVLRGVGAGGATVLAVDATVHSCKRVFDVRQVRLAGGGGTDMGVGIERAAKLKPRPHVIIVLTDFYTPWPANPPAGVKVIGVAVGNNAATGNAPSWLRVIEAR